MVSLRRPSSGMIREFLASQSKLGFTYTAVGATSNEPPAGYVVDHTRFRLGRGEEVFTRAKARAGAVGAVRPGLGGGVVTRDADPVPVRSWRSCPGNSGCGG